MDPKRSPEISVLLCVYNGEKTLQAALDSLKRQTFSNFEIIAINDGSTDGTATVLNEYAQKEPRLKVYHQDNQGLTRSLNDALKFATGKYVARQDADDESLPSRFETCLEAIGNAPGCVTAWENESRGEISIPFFSWCLIKGRVRIVRLLSRFFNPLVHGTFFFERQTALAIGGYDTRFRLAQDHDLYLRLSRKANWAMVPKVCYRLFLSQESLSQKKQKEQALYSLVALLRFRDAAKFEALAQGEWDLVKTASLLLRHRRLRSFPLVLALGFRYRKTPVAKDLFQLWFQTWFR